MAYSILKLGCKLQNEPMKGWPYFIDYDLRPVEKPFVLWEGINQGSAGGSYTAAEILNSSSLFDHLRLSGTEWLEPLLRRAAAGEKIGEAELVKEYEKVHGKPPEREMMAG